MAVFQNQRLFLWAVFCLSMVSCSPFQSKKPPIILILLESFSEQDYLCGNQRKIEDLFNLQEVCKEFIRYTHVYAPTTLTQPNLSSLFSGLPVASHGVLTNGPQAISSRVQTIAEEALSSQRRTGFFSGGVPLFRKFGLSQGFEAFEEPFLGRKPKLFKNFSETVADAMSWLDQEVVKDSFFMTFYVPDLMYKNRVTQDGLDNERPIGRASSLQEVYETMNDLIAELRKRKRWRQSHFIVLGVSGPTHSVRPYNPLSGQYLHVPLQIKLSSSVKSNLSELTSEMVSFAKLGQWLKQLILHQPDREDLILTPQSQDLFIPQVSTWSWWQQLTPWTTVGLRRKQYLFSYNPDLQVFDTFYDKREYEALADDEAQRLAEKFDLNKRRKDFFKQTCFEGAGLCRGDQLQRKTLMQLSQLIRWDEIKTLEETPSSPFREKMAEALQEDHKILLNWLATQALYERRWVDLFELGKTSDHKSWMLVAQLNLRESPSEAPEGCLKYFVGERKNISDFYQHCDDPGLRKVVEGLDFLKMKKRPSESFWSQLNEIRMRRLAKNLNMKMFFVNDIKAPFSFEPSLSELYFFLPENMEFQDLLDGEKS